MNTTLYANGTKFDARTRIRILIIVILALVAAALILLPGEFNPNDGPAPSLTGKIVSVIPATSGQKNAQGEQVLGTLLIQRNDGYQLQLRVSHASGSGCLGNSTLHLFDIHVGETTTVRYWLDTPDSASNPHKGDAVYVGGRC